MPLQFGYKASAEQFGPQRLLDLAVAAEKVRFRLRLDERSLPAVAPHRRPCPERARLARRGIAGHQRVTLGTSVLTPSFRYNPAMVAQAFATLVCWRRSA